MSGVTRVKGPRPVRRTFATWVNPTFGQHLAIESTCP
jgi:hypothetical protein